MKNLLILMSLTFVVQTSAFAGTSHFIKKEREDFNALIQAGLDSQKELRKELRKNVGDSAEQNDWVAEVNKTGRELITAAPAEQIVAPTTNYVRQSPRVPVRKDKNEDRISQELESLEH